MYENLKHPNLGLTSAQIQEKIDALHTFQVGPGRESEGWRVSSCPGRAARS